MTLFFAIDSIWFWSAFAVCFIGLFWMEASENGFGEALFFVAMLAGFQWLGKQDLIGYVSTHWLETLKGVGAYLLIGVLWSMGKWYLFVRDRLTKYQEAKDNFFAQCRGGEVNGTGKIYVANSKLTTEEEYVAEWKKKCKDHSGWIRDMMPPQASKEKARLARWMAWWPTSLVWTICSDFITGVFKRLVKYFSGVFQAISDKVYAKHKADFE